MKHTLFMSLRSPFARRVRLVLEELGLDYETEVIDVFNPPASLFEINPVGRVPVLITPTGEALIESWQIGRYLEAHFGSHALFSFAATSEARARSLSGLSVALMEFSVAAYLESVRGPGVTSVDALQEYRDMARNALKFFERELAATRGLLTYSLTNDLRVWDLDLGTALAYAKLRLGSDVLEPYPSLRSYLSTVDLRASFAKTAPPA